MVKAYCHSNKIESVGLRKCPHDNCRTYLSDITETIFRVMPTTCQRIPNGIDVDRNDVTVTLYGMKVCGKLE